MQNADQSFNSLKDTNPVIKDSHISLSYTKTNKLVTALYMVTDILEKDEPIRIKLRTLGADIISDIHSLPTKANNKISALVSLLDIASSINLISAMNHSILKKEFTELKNAIENSKTGTENPLWLEEFIKAEISPISPLTPLQHPQESPLSLEKNYKGHGVSDRLVSSISLVKKTAPPAERFNKEKFNDLKSQRREEIIKMIKEKKEVSIKDISIALKSLGKDRGEKTLQRELFSMVSHGVLKKVGEKRWSRYSLAK